MKLDVNKGKCVFVDNLHAPTATPSILRRVILACALAILGEGRINCFDINTYLMLDGQDTRQFLVGQRTQLDVASVMIV